MTARASFVCIGAVKSIGAIALLLGLSACMTLENRRDLYSADFDRWPVRSTTTVQTRVPASTRKTQHIKTRKTAPELKPIPNEPEETSSLPSPLPPP